ncbi:MAG: hypothetical protein ACR2MG_02755 [Pyrinomonadaceae bacterium]
MICWLPSLVFVAPPQNKSDVCFDRATPISPLAFAQLRALTQV